MKKRTMKFRFKLILLALFLAYAGFTIYGQQTKIESLRAEQDVLAETEQQVETQLQRLEHKYEYMNTEEYVEKAAKKIYGMTNEDEIVIEQANDIAE